MPALEIIKPGLMTSIQDPGRYGLAYYAIPPSGAMDRVAAKYANHLLNQGTGSPVIECTASGPEIKFLDPGEIALTGANFQWKLNGTAVTRQKVINVKSGDTLSGGYAIDGLRGYVGIGGELQADHVYGSCATYVNAGLGGFHGRFLRTGDLIHWKKSKTRKISRIEPQGLKNESLLALHPGPDLDKVNRSAIQNFLRQVFTLHSDSNRMGARLSGTAYPHQIGQLDFSAPVFPGFMQLLPNGQPVIILQDGQTTGGYLRIAYLESHELSRFNQIPLGGKVKFSVFD
jgi:antagonist of KipI